MIDRMDWLEGFLLPLARRADWIAHLLHGKRLEERTEARLLQAGKALDRRRLSRELDERLKSASTEALFPDDPRYPLGCMHLSDPPLALFVRGEQELLSATVAVGVVGARRGTERGRLCSERLGAALASAGLPVVSGLAFGVDGASHRGCLAGGGSPIGVVGTGLDVVYPTGHLELQEDVARLGCLVSEHPPGTPPLRHHFLARNRIIAALCRCLVVVEAGARSGALSTVDFALQLGREIMAYPGPVDDPHAAGCLALLRDGATLVRHPGDVLESLGLASEADDSSHAPLGMSEHAESPAEIASRLDTSLESVLATLADLELEGLVRRMPGGRYALRAGGMRARAPRRDERQPGDAGSA